MIIDSARGKGHNGRVSERTRRRMERNMATRTTASIALLACTLAHQRPCRAEEAAGAGQPNITLGQVRTMRKAAARRKRRIIFHSDGKPMDSGNMRFPCTPGTQTDACTYSLIHQFNLARFYPTKVAQPWPPGYLEKYREEHGDKPNDLQRYITFCHANNFEAFWAQRMNDTHDFGYTENARWKFENNEFKQAHPQFLIGELASETPSSPDGKWRVEDFEQCPHGRCTSVDYTHEEVRDLLFRSWEEVCRNYAIDGLMFDFFRHPTLFRSVAWGKKASAEELEMITGLLRRTRKMADEIGAARGRPILFIARTPDHPAYARALGLDIERWMQEDVIDIWLATGYFRLQEWTEIVKVGRRHGVPVWASMDEVRTGRPAGNSAEAYRARAMNMWNAGVDGIYLFNFNYKPPAAQYQLLHEIGDPATMAHLPRMYVPDARGDGNAKYWVKDGYDYLTRPLDMPYDLSDGKPRSIDLLVGDDLAAAKAAGLTPVVKLRLYVAGLADRAALLVRLNDEVVEGGGLEVEKKRIRFQLAPERLNKGVNRFEIGLAVPGDARVVLEDLQVWISYR